MTQNIKRINDPEQLHRITGKLFVRLPVQLQEKNGIFPVTVQEYRESHLFLVHNQPEASIRLLSLSHGQNKMFLECTVVERDPEGVERVKPVRLHLKRQVREQERIQLGARENNRVAWITNLITLKSIPEFLAAYNEKRDILLTTYREELGRIFHTADIVFRKTFRMDVRMRAMTNLKKPIFVPSRMTPNAIDAGRFVPYEEYKKIIQYDHMADTIVAEITEPLSYKEAYMFGYMKVLSDQDLSGEDYEKVHQIARDFEEEFITNDFLPGNPERCVVVDINLSGVGFMHPHNPSIIRNFMPGEHVIFELHFPGEETATPFMGVIRNMKSFEKAHRIGVEFENLDNGQKAQLTHYIGSITSVVEASPE